MKKPIVHKNYRQLYFETGKSRVMEILFRNPDKEFSLSQLAKEAKVAKANIGKILDELLKSDFIEVTRLSNLMRIVAKKDSFNFMRTKIGYNLNFVYQSGLVEFLYDYFNSPKAIVLFGSFRKGDDIAGSDIDVAIEMDRNKECEIVRLKELSEFEKEIGKDIQVHLFGRNKVDINVFNNIANGIVLLGFLEVKK